MNHNPITLIKSLLGLQDLAIGRGSYEQRRGKTNVLVTKVEIPLIVPVIATYDIDNIDIEKFKVLLCLNRAVDGDKLGGIFVYDPSDTSSTPSNDILVGLATKKTFKRISL